MATSRLPEQLARRLLLTRGGQVLVLLALLVGVVLLSGWWFWDRMGAGPSVPGAAEAMVRIGTWDLGQRSAGDIPDMEAMAAGIRASGMDIVAVRGMRGAGEALDRLLAHLNERTPAWSATIPSPRSSAGDRFVFLYRADRVREASRARPIDGADAASLERVPYVAGFSTGQVEFLLMSVYIEGSQSEPLRRQGESLVRLAQGLVAGAGQSVIVLGHFGGDPGATLSLFHGAGWQQLVEGASADNLLIDPRRNRHWLGRAEAIPSRPSAPAYADFATHAPDSP